MSRYVGEIALRRATEADLAAIMAVEHNCFAADAWSEANMHLELVSHHTFYWVATAQVQDGAERVVAYAGLSKVASSEQADVQTIAVEPEFRGQGLGRRLMKRLIAEARVLAAAEMFLEVRADNPVAQRLYESLGFESIDRRKAYYQPDGVDALVLRSPLEPINREPVVLGIESSCDETGVGIVRGTNLLAHVISSSMDEHARFGGVVPEIAARAHLEALEPTIRQALAEAGSDSTGDKPLQGPLEEAMEGKGGVVQRQGSHRHTGHRDLRHPRADDGRQGQPPEPASPRGAAGGHQRSHDCDRKGQGEGRHLRAGWAVGGTGKGKAQ